MSARTLAVAQHRTLALADDGATVELHAPSGALELRIRITAAGPVVEVTASRLELRARDAIDITSRRVAIHATEALSLATGGDATLDARGDVRVVGATIYLN